MEDVHRANVLGLTKTSGKDDLALNCHLLQTSNQRETAGEARSRDTLELPAGRRDRLANIANNFILWNGIESCYSSV